MQTSDERRSFGEMIGRLIVRALAPIKKRLEDLETREYTIDSGVIEDIVTERLDPINQTIDALPAILTEKIGKPKDGVDGQGVTEEQIAEAVADHFRKHPVPVPKDGEPGQDGAPGQNGTSVTVDDVRQILEGEVAKGLLDFERRAHSLFQSAIDKIPHPKDGQDSDPREVATIVIEQLGLNGVIKHDVQKLCRELVAKAFDSLPKPEKPEKPTDDEILSAVERYMAANPVREPVDGADASPEDIAKAVSSYMEEHPVPVPKDGTSVTAEEVLPFLRDELMKAVEDIPAPKDGKDGTSVTVKDLEPVLKAMMAEWALDFEKRAQDVLRKAVEQMPKAKDGRDGLSIKDLSMQMLDDDKTLQMIFDDGVTRKVFDIVTCFPRYRMVWKAADSYLIGDSVTFDGSIWVAIEPSTDSRPGQNNKAWRLAVKKGRNGRSAK